MIIRESKEMQGSTMILDHNLWEDNYIIAILHPDDSIELVRKFDDKKEAIERYEKELDAMFEYFAELEMQQQIDADNRRKGY